jgi:alpha-L-rhamnosidase
MGRIAFLLTWLTTLCLTTEAQQVSVAPYLDGRRAALTLTFDDGLQDQYTLAYPELKKRGLKATFAIIGSKVGGIVRSKQDRADGTDGTPCMTWDMLREMAADGQEIASHGWEHRNVTKLDSEALRQEVVRNDSAIAKETGQYPVTFVYPGNAKSAEAIAFCEQGRVGSRTYQLSLGAKRTTAFLRHYLDSLVARGEWGVTMTHGIAQGYDHFKDPHVLWTFLDDLQLRQQEIWVAPFRDVAAYVKERENTQLVVKQTANALTITPKTTLEGKQFQHPLTLIVNAPVATATQAGRSLECMHKGDITLININPNGGKIVIKNELLPTHLTVEGRIEPMGLDEEHPRLGWQIYTDKKNVSQQSYHIQVATSKTGKVDVWDSGIVNSDQSQWVEIGGRLQPNNTYYWRVKIKTNKGESQWSHWSHWTTGLLKEENWKGEWIGYDSLTADVKMERHSRIAARHLHKSFTLAKPVKRATAHICGLGYYILNINGQRIGDYLLAPAPTQYDKAVCYNTYDVTTSLHSPLSTLHSIDVVLAGGYFFPMTQNHQTNVKSAFGMPKLRMNLIVEYEDGTSETIATDSTWQVAVDGPIRYANLYDGTLVDYRCQPTAWMPVQMVKAPCKMMRGGMLEGVKVYQTESVKTLTKTGQDTFILDFGTNNTGRMYLPSARIANGDTIRIRYAETLKENGKELYTANLRSAQNTDFFVGNGSAVTMTTEFLWHGFRYMEVKGLDEADARRIQRQLMTDDLLSDATINIDEDDGMLNKILDNARRGILSNYKGIPMDCPQRDERMPWLGDRTMGCFGESYLTHNHTLYSKWMQDICDAQRPDGNISDVCPAYWRLYNGNITWPAALPFGLEMLRLQYGDERPWKEHAESVKRFLAFAKKKSGKDGLITYDRYGDWCVPPATLDEVVTKDSTRMTDGALLSSCYYYYICKLMGMDEEAAVTRETINRTFLQVMPDGTAFYAPASRRGMGEAPVTANLLPLAMDIVPDEARSSVMANFVRRVKAPSLSGRAGGESAPHIDCGVIGISWLMRYLSKAGLGDVAYQIASTKTYPGWGYMVENGATTIWELWNGNTANPSMNSGNHVMMLGDLIPWAYECVAGIAPDTAKPGFKHIIMHPDFSIDSIHGAKATYPSLYGSIVSDWHRENSRIVWNVEIPANTTATLRFPNGKTKTIGSGHYTFKTKQSR